METDHVVELASIIDRVVNAYEHGKDCDVNDVLSALAIVLIARCRECDIPRMEILRNIGTMYERTEPGSLN